MTSESVKYKATVFFNSIPKNKWKFFHKKSIDNFISYLPKIKSESDKEEIAVVINNYFKSVENIHFEEIDICLSQDLFRIYLMKLNNKYNLNYYFVPIFTWDVVAIFLFAVIGLCYIFSYNIYILSTIVTIVSLYTGRIIIKMIQGKVYGFQY